MSFPPMMSTALRPLSTTVIRAGATNAYRAFRYARRTSASATSGTMPNTIGSIDAAVLTSPAEMPGAVARISGHARIHESSTKATPIATTEHSTMEMRWSVACSPRFVDDVRNAGTSAWFAATMTTATSPMGMRDATKKASVFGPAPKLNAMLTSRISPASTPAPAAIPVRPDCRKTARFVCRPESPPIASVLTRTRGYAAQPSV